MTLQRRNDELVELLLADFFARGDHVVLNDDLWIELDERAASPANPAADRIRVFSRDDGAGNSQLCFIDSAGTVTCMSPGIGIPHNVLSATHTDSTVQAVSRGSIVYGNSTPAWDELTIGVVATFLRSDGTDPSWSAIQVTDLPVHNLLSAQHGDTVVNAVSRGSIVYGDSSPNWNELVHPGGAGYAFTTDANDVRWDQTPTWTGLHTFNAGITFAGASGANNVTVPDNTAIAIELLDAGGLEYLRLVTTNTQPVIKWNEGGVDVDYHIEASGAPDAFFLQGSDGYIGYGTIPDTMAHWSSAVSGDPSLLIENTNTNVWPSRIIFRKNTASPADDDNLGLIDFRGETDASANVRYASILGYSEDVTDLDSAGSIIFNVRMDNVDVRNLLELSGYNGSVNQGEVIINQDGQDVDTRVEASGQPNALYIQGNSGNVGICTIPGGAYRLHIYEASDDVTLAVETDVANGEAEAVFINDVQAWRLGTQSDDVFAIIDETTAMTGRLLINLSGHVYPGGNKTQDLGLTGSRWRTLYQGTSTAAGTSRLFESTRDCPVCSTRMVRGTGSLCILGEDRDYEAAHCPKCGIMAVEEIRHLPTKLLASRRPPPIIEFLGLGVFPMSGNSRKVQVHFRYGWDDDGNAILNSTFLGETELAALMDMSVEAQRIFLLELGIREWDALEEQRLQQEQVAILQNRLDILTGGLVGVDLLH